MDQNAGALLAYHPLASDSFVSRRHDLDFKDFCCTKGGGCEMFRMRRPTNNGTGYQPPAVGKVIDNVLIIIL